MTDSQVRLCHPRESSIDDRTSTIGSRETVGNLQQIVGTLVLDLVGTETEIGTEMDAGCVIGTGNETETEIEMPVHTTIIAGLVTALPRRLIRGTAATINVTMKEIEVARVLLEHGLLTRPLHRLGLHLQLLLPALVR